MSYETKLLDMMPNFGRPPKFKTAKQLMDKFIEYVHTVDEMPIKVSQAVKKRGKKAEIDSQNNESFINLVAHPLSIREFCLFAGITNWSEFKTHKRNQTKDFLIVIARIENYTVNQQVNGALSGLYNANIVARLNGIVEHTEVNGSMKVKNEDNRTPEEILASVRRLNALSNIIEKEMANEQGGKHRT